jgi:hypothetical protein
MSLDHRKLEHWLIVLDRNLESGTDDYPADLPSSAVRLGRYVVSLTIQSLDQPEEKWLPDSCGGSLGDNPELFAEHLQMQDRLHRDRLEEAVMEWSCSQVRPKLARQLDNYLGFRISAGRSMLQYLLAGEDDLPEGLAEPPDADSHEFLRWLLIDVWDVIGDSFLEEVAKCIKADFEAEEGPDGFH